MTRNFVKIILASSIWFTTIGPVISQTMIRGVVLDVNTEKPIANVHIIENRSQRSTISDHLGKFIISVGKFPVILNASHISYEIKNSILQKVPENEIRILLTPNNHEIEEVLVIGNEVQQFFKEDLFSVNEFVFSERIIWILGYANNNRFNAEIRALKLSGELISKKKVPQKTELGLDAYGNVHQVQEDSVMQLYLDNDSITVVGIISNGKERETLINLQAVVDSIAILKRVNSTGIYNEYVGFDFRDSSNQVFHEAFDKDLFKSPKTALNYTHGRIPTYVFPPWPAGYDPMMSYEFTEHAQNRFNTYTPISSQLFIHNDSIIIYQDRNPNITIYDNHLKLIKEFNLENGSNERLFRLLNDSYTGNFYLLSAIKDDFFISLINPVSGEILQTRQENSLRFVKNIKAFNNRIYFVAQTRLGLKTMNLYSLRFETR